MQIAPVAIAAIALFAVSRGKKKKPKESAEPRVERFGRVERLLNAAAVRESGAGELIPTPTIAYIYVKKGPTLDRMTHVMSAQAEMFQSVAFYQLPFAALKQALKVEGSPMKGIAGAISGAHPDKAFWYAEIFPNDDIKDMSIKVAHRILFALTGVKPKIKES